ncbi:MAG TPA: glycosyltransferase family 2 protein [Acidobacteriaceae bacterium]|nr:glycosyltransferase family 2 protein [Acidobacteriaceae bacterium]
MKVLFWLCAIVVAYAYFGYAICLWLRVRLSTLPVLRGSITPPVSVVIAARNEEANLPAKLRNLREIDYPAEQMQVVIASDGSTDRTAEILEENAPFVHPVILEKNGGKAAALNAVVQHATGEILIFLDARQVVEPNAVRELVSAFADPQIGAVSGELLLGDGDGDTGSEGLGIYWKIEKMVRKLESASGSVVGVTGAIYAIRRECFTEIPSGAILDDVFIPMQVARMGKRVIFEPRARAHDRIFRDPGKEFSRKVRTLTGNYQLIQMSPWLLTPANPLFLRFISHKLLRLVVPFLLLATLILSALVPGRLYRGLFWAQVIFYGLALLGMSAPAIRTFRPVAIAKTFVMLNWAAVLAFYNFVVGNTEVWN